MATPGPVAKLERTSRLDLEEELRLAEDDLARGDFVDITVAQLDASAAAGEWPWPSGSSE